VVSFPLVYVQRAPAESYFLFVRVLTTEPLYASACALPNIGFIGERPGVESSIRIRLRSEPRANVEMVESRAFLLLATSGLGKCVSSRPKLTALQDKQGPSAGASIHRKVWVSEPECRRISMT